jgi:hypothetical protein
LVLVAAVCFTDGSLALRPAFTGAAAALTLAVDVVSWQTTLPLFDVGDGVRVFAVRTPIRYHCGRPLFPGSTFDGPALQSWTRRGEAFPEQPLGVGLPAERRKLIRPDGGFMGSYEAAPNHRGGDAALGSLESPEFELDGEDLVFLVSGGRDRNALFVSLEIDGVEVRRTTGEGDELLRARSWRVAPFRGKRARIRVVDQSPGGWGHLNVDGFCYRR